MQADIDLFSKLYDHLKSEIERPKRDIELVRFCLEMMGAIARRSAVSMLDELQRIGKRDLLTDEEMKDAAIALVAAQPAEREGQ